MGLCAAGAPAASAGPSTGSSGGAVVAKKKCKKSKSAASAKKKAGCKKKQTPPPASTPGGTTTPPVDPPPPADTDGDTIPDANDNCASFANTDQADADADQKGDACDFCPNEANPGAQGCSTTIYNINKGVTPQGAPSRLVQVLVTAVAPDGDSVWVQHKVSDPDYSLVDGLDYAGLQLDTSGITLPGGLQAGNRVTVDGTSGVNLLTASAIQLNTASVEPVSKRATTAADFANYALFRPKLANQVVELSGLTLTSTAGGVWALTDGANGFEAGPRLMGAFPACADGAQIGSITGIALDEGTELYLLPRSGSDIDQTDC